ncbi:DUF2087 domain-containing protein [Anaerocolumna sp.]|uniref:DUF2087 domain-containing protein n=1 Tax=Anaerocolumna sp. TaxID=2041569 RepID=UPI0028A5B76D|nr:DUF2087 domain-containing protein [Anaerocolumna sp.]
MEHKINIKRFLDDSNRIIQLPKNNKTRFAVLEYLSEKFETNCTYTEKEVNNICNEWHTFGDYFVLRRELVDNGLLCREADGSRYWKTQINQKDNV